MVGHDLVFFLNAFIRVQSVKIRGLIIWLRLCRAVLLSVLCVLFCSFLILLILIKIQTTHIKYRQIECKNYNDDYDTDSNHENRLNDCRKSGNFCINMSIVKF